LLLSGLYLFLFFLFNLFFLFFLSTEVAKKEKKPSWIKEIINAKSTDKEKLRVNNEKISLIIKIGSPSPNLYYKGYEKCTARIPEEPWDSQFE